jgi:hypothetical protein
MTRNIWTSASSFGLIFTNRDVINPLSNTLPPDESGDVNKWQRSEQGVCSMYTRTIFIAASATSLLVAGMASVAIHAPAAKAEPPNCQTSPWGFLGSQRREICDGPVQPDGSWMRHRVIGIPAHYENPSSSCYGDEGYSNCTFYPGGWVDDQISDDETYPVNPDTVLPDEPGHLG